MKRIAVITALGALLALVLIPSASKSQQISANSQYLQNPYIINPAASGINDGLDISSSYRKQWAGLQEAPQTYYLSGQAAINKPRQNRARRYSLRGSRFRKFERNNDKVYHAVGGFMARDEAGAFRKTLVKASYAVHVPFSSKLTVSFGAAGGVSRFELDRSKVDFFDSNDPSYQNFLRNGSTPGVFDLSAGIWAYTSRLFVGYSSEQILRNDIIQNRNGNRTVYDLHHFLTAGYDFSVNESWNLVPSFLIRYVNPAPATFDINLQASYLDQYWAGLSYRHQNAIVLLAGVRIVDWLNVGYSFDYPTTAIRSHANGSHEFFLNFSGLIMKYR